MGFFDSVKDFGGGRFAGEMTSEGSGARIKAGVRDIPIIGDVDLVNVHVPGFNDGGVVGEDNGAGRRQGGRDAPTSRRKASGQSPSRAATGGHEWGQRAHPLASVVGGASVGFTGMGQGSYYCPSCAAGITKPLT